MSYPGQYPGSQFQPYQQPKKGGSGLMILGLLGGGALVLVIACCGGLTMLLRTPTPSAAAREPFTLAEVPPPPFEERENAEKIEIEQGVVQYIVEIGDEEGGFYDQPGHGGYMYLYLPAGDHPPKSLGCLLVAPAGSTLLAGMYLSEGDEPEQIPYVKAGYAVIAYEMDGPSYSDDPNEIREGYQAFRKSRAGLVNARNALDYVLAKVPEVDPTRIYAAGSSSAGTHVLLLAAHEPRLAGVIAYCPECDLPSRMAPTMPLMRFILPGLVDFVTQSSPNTHAKNIKCPTFLFHSKDDQVCPYSHTSAFAELLKGQGTDVTFVSTPTGDHYESMISDGIPAGIEWLRNKQATK